jgi:hypothetical protein
MSYARAVSCAYGQRSGQTRFLDCLHDNHFVSLTDLRSDVPGANANRPPCSIAQMCYQIVTIRLQVDDIACLTLQATELEGQLVFTPGAGQLSAAQVVHGTASRRDQDS